MRRLRYICGGLEGSDASGSEADVGNVTPEFGTAAAAFSFSSEAAPFTTASSLVGAMLWRALLWRACLRCDHGFIITSVCGR